MCISQHVRNNFCTGALVASFLIHGFLLLCNKQKNHKCPVWHALMEKRRRLFFSIDQCVTISLCWALMANQMMFCLLKFLRQVSGLWRLLPEQLRGVGSLGRGGRRSSFRSLGWVTVDLWWCRRQIYLCCTTIRKPPAAPDSCCSRFYWCSLA